MRKLKIQNKNKEIVKKLRKKKFVIGIPTIIKFKMFSENKKFHKFKATKGTEVVKWKDILKVFKEVLKNRKI